MVTILSNDLQKTKWGLDGRLMEFFDACSTNYPSGGGVSTMSETVQPVSPGQAPRLRRGLRVLGALLITLSAITPASSVFIIAPGVIGQAGTGAIWSFLAAGVVGVFMAFVYAELASAYPLTGGEYAIVGRTLGRLPGFMIMGLIMVTQVIIIAVIALGVGI
jgi:amino acid transporter